MSFYVRYEDRLAHDLSANGTSILHDNEIGHFPGYGLFVLASNFVTRGAAILKQVLQADDQDRVGAWKIICAATLALPPQAPEWQAACITTRAPITCSGSQFGNMNSPRQPGAGFLFYR